MCNRKYWNIIKNVCVAVTVDNTVSKSEQNSVEITRSPEQNYTLLTCDIEKTENVDRKQHLSLSVSAIQSKIGVTEEQKAKTENEKTVVVFVNN